MPDKEIYAAVRLERLQGLRALQAASDHANRMDATSQLRVRKGADSSLNLRLNPWKGDRVEDASAPFDLVADFENNKASRNLRERSNAAAVAHIIFQVSREWIEQGGDRHDPANPHNQAWFKCGVDWVEAEFGQGSLLSARLDLDEAGSGTVDLFVCCAAKTKTGQGYLSISPKLKEIKQRYNGRKTFVALQDCVAEYVQKNLDASILRGKPKEGRGPDRLTPEAYKARVVNERRKGRLEFLWKGVKAQRRELKRAEQAVAARAIELQRQEAVLKHAQAAVAVERAEFAIRMLAEGGRIQAQDEAQARHVQEQAARFSAEKEWLDQHAEALARRELDLQARETTARKQKDDWARMHAQAQAELHLGAEALAEREAAIDDAREALGDEATEALEAARREGLQQALAGQQAAISAARAKAVEEGKAEGLRLADAVRPIHLDKVMAMLGGKQDADDGRRWTLPSLGAVVIDANKPHRFRIEKTKKTAGGAIDLVMLETGFDFAQSVNFLRTEIRAADVMADRAHAAAMLAKSEVEEVIQRKPHVALEDRAPVSPEVHSAQANRKALHVQFKSAGISEEVFQAAVRLGGLEAVRQGDRLLARWPLKNGGGEIVGFGLEAVDGSFSMIRGQSGHCLFTAKRIANDDPAKREQPQFWLADTPVQAMAALSAANQFGVERLAPKKWPRIFAAWSVGSETKSAIVDMVKSAGGSVVLCLPDTASGRRNANIIGEALMDKDIKSANYSKILRLLKFETWAEAARALMKNATELVAAVQHVFGAKPDTPGAQRRRHDGHER